MGEILFIALSLAFLAAWRLLAWRRRQASRRQAKRVELPDEAHSTRGRIREPGAPAVDHWDEGDC